MGRKGKVDIRIGALNNPRKDVIEEIHWIGKNGFDFVDLTLEFPRAHTVNILEVENALAHYNLDIIGHTDGRLPYAYPIKDIRDACFKELGRCFDTFAQLGVKLVTIHPNYGVPICLKSEMLELNIEALTKISDLAKQFGLVLMLENFISPFDTVKAYQKIIENIPDLMIHLDVGHANINQSKNQSSEFFKNFSERILHIHVSDNKGKGDDHLPLGCGNISWQGIIKILKKHHYDKTVTLEVFSGDKDYLLFSKNLFKQWLTRY